MMKKVLSTGGSFTDNGKTYVVNGHRFNCDNLLDIATSKAFKPTFMPDALEICKKITTTVKDQNGQLCNLCYGCAYQPIGDNASPVNITTTEFVDDEDNKKHALQVKLSQADMNLLNSCVDNYDANFLNIATKLADLEHTPLRAFIFYILSHYQLKVTDRFRQAPQCFVAKSDEADPDKAIKNYSNLLISSVNNSANVVINSFLIFVKSKNELDNMSLIDAYDHSNLEYAVQDEISQVVADYLSTEKIENLATLPTMDDLMDDLLDLSDQAKEELNLILANADLNKLDFKTEVLNDNDITPQIAWNALLNSLEETYRIFSYGLSSQEIQSAFRLLKDDSFYPGIALACDLYHRTCSKPINEEQLKFFDPLVKSYEQDLMKEYAGVAKVEQEYLDYDIGLCYDTKVDWKELVERLHDLYEDPSEFELNEDTIQSAFKLIDDDNFSPCTRLAILQNMYSFVGEIITPAQNFKL